MLAGTGAAREDSPEIFPAPVFQPLAARGVRRTARLTRPDARMPAQALGPGFNATFLVQHCHLGAQRKVKARRNAAGSWWRRLPGRLTNLS